MLVNVDYHITDHCNLNCAHCNHFSPLVPKETKHKSIEQITADLSLLSKFKNDIGTVALLGGEPFLHPQLSKILRITRQIFPNNEISLTSNGTLADKILQWKDSIEENNIQLVITIYPYKQDAWENYNKIKNIISSTSYWDFPIKTGMMYHELSNQFGVATDQEIKDCVKRWRCNQLKDGKLWICHYAAQLNVLKNAFPGQVNIDVDDRCYLDLNNDDLTIDDIYEWQRTTWPGICMHCVDAHYGGYGGPTKPWETTKKELSEWVE